MPFQAGHRSQLPIAERPRDLHKRARPKMVGGWYTADEAAEIRRAVGTRTMREFVLEMVRGTAPPPKVTP